MLPLLHGVRVVDLCRLIPGDIATKYLADLGAEVIKLEEPPRGDYIRHAPPMVDGLGGWDIEINRNKKSVGVSLKHEAGVQLFWDLVATADVVVEVSRPGAFQRLGIDAASVLERHPGLVYCSITGFGQFGPYRDLPSHGLNIDAAAGLIKVEIGDDGLPNVVKLGTATADTGGTSAALAVLAALVQRGRTGKGQYVDASCWDAGVSANRAFGLHLNFGSRRDRSYSAESLLQGAKYNVYCTADDRVVLVAPIEQVFWERFCVVVGREEWLARGNWIDGQPDVTTDDLVLRMEIQEVIRTRPLAEWMDRFIAAGVPAAPVNDLNQLEVDPHLEARRLVVRTTDPRYPTARFVGPGYTVPEADFAVERPPPRLGEHTNEVALGLGYPPSKIDALIANGVLLQSAH